MNQTVDYFVLGIAASIMGQYKQDFAAMWDAAVLTDGSYDVSGVVAVIAAIGLGWLIAFPVAGPLSDRLGRRLSALVGYALYAVFLLAVTFSPNLYVGYALAIVSGMANSFLDTSITPSCMEIFKEKGTIANIFTGLSISIARFLLPFVISFVAVRKLPFRTIFLATAALIIVDGVFLAFLPFPSFEWTVKAKDAPKERMQFTPPPWCWCAWDSPPPPPLCCGSTAIRSWGPSTASLIPAAFSPSIPWGSSWRSLPARPC